MEHFDSPRSKSLSLIHSLCESRRVSFAEQSRLKGTPQVELVDTGRADVRQALQQYDADKDADALFAALVAMVNTPQAGPMISIPSRVLATDETTSPQDTFLLSRKKFRGNKPEETAHEHALTITEVRETAEADEHKE